MTDRLVRFMNSVVPAVLLLGLAAAFGVPAEAQGEEAAKLGWFDTAELSLFASSGNSEVQTIALRNTATRLWTDSSLEIAAGAARAETTSTSRVAVGTVTDFTVNETSETALTAENYFLRGRYGRDISGKLFWSAGLGWDRNEFAGIANRIAGFGGVGHLWLDTESARFRTDYGVTHTDEEEVSGFTNSFAGVRLSYDYWRQLNVSTRFASTLIVDENLDESSDYRADFTNSVSAAMSEKLALKASLQLLYDNQPALTDILLIQGDFIDGTRVLAELDNLDSILTVSLVANF